MIEFKVFKIHQERPQFSTDDGWQFAPLHWVYAIKHDGRHKAQLVIGGHVKNSEGYNTFSSTVRMEHVRLQVFLAAYFGDSILSGDIRSAYLNAETKEKIYTKLGVEFGTQAGLTSTVQKVLYGLKSSGNAFYMNLCDTLKKL